MSYSRLPLLAICLLWLGLAGCVIGGSWASSEFYKGEVRADSAVRILAERPIPYGGKHRELTDVLLPKGDLVLLRSISDDTAILQRLDKDSFGVRWERSFVLSGLDSWSPSVYHEVSDSSIQLVSLRQWADEDSIGLHFAEFDAATGTPRSERWILKTLSENDSQDVRTGYRMIRSEDDSKVMFYYIDFRGVTETDNDSAKTIDVVFEVFDQKFTKLGGGVIRRELPWEVGDDEDEISDFYRGTIVDNVGNVFVVTLMTPNKIQVTKHLIASGTQRTLQVDYPGVDILYSAETYGRMAYTSDHVDNLYLAAPWKSGKDEVGGVILAKFNFNTRNIPVATGVKITEEQAEALVGDNGLKFYGVSAVTLDEGIAVVHLEHGVITEYERSGIKWRVEQQNDVVLLGFDQQGNALYQTVLKKSQMSNRVTNVVEPELGYRCRLTPQGLRFYYLDRSLGGIVTRLMDTKTGALTVPYAVLGLGLGTGFIRHCSHYDYENDAWYFTMHKGVGSQAAHIYKVAMTERLLRKAEKIY